MGSDINEQVVLYDSSILFFCAGQIGYRWAVKVTYMAAANLVKGLIDTLALAEVLDYFHQSGDPDRGKTVFLNAREIFHHSVSVTEEDFILSMKLHEKYPDVSPRALLRAAVMINNDIDDICSTFAAGFESVEEIRRVNLMEKVGYFEKICHRL